MLMDGENLSLIERTLPLSLAMPTYSNLLERLVLQLSDRVVAFVENGEVKIRITEIGKNATRDYTLPPELWQVTIDEMLDAAIGAKLIDAKYRDACLEAMKHLPGVERGAYMENGNFFVARPGNVDEDFIIPKSCYDETTITINANIKADREFQSQIIARLCLGSLFIPIVLILYAKGKFNFLKRLIPKPPSAQRVPDLPFIVKQKVSAPTKPAPKTKETALAQESEQVETYAEKARKRNRKKLIDNWVKEQDERDKNRRGF